MSQKIETQIESFKKELDRIVEQRNLGQLTPAEARIKCFELQQNINELLLGGHAETDQIVTSLLPGLA
jgi:hypothetical protein